MSVKRFLPLIILAKCILAKQLSPPGVKFRPDPIGSGFFIDIVLPYPEKFIPFKSSELPPHVNCRYLREPEKGSYPSLLVLPLREPYLKYLSDSIPILGYGEYSFLIDQEKSRTESALCDFLCLPLDRVELKSSIRRNFRPYLIMFPEGWLEVTDQGLSSTWGNLSLSAKERQILKAFLAEPEHFLTRERISQILDVKCVVCFLSRLRVRLKQFLPQNCPVSIRFCTLRSVGYYLGISVDNCG